MALAMGEDVNKPTSNQTKENQMNISPAPVVDKRPGNAGPTGIGKINRRNIVRYLKATYRFLSREGAEEFVDQLLMLNRDHFEVMECLKRKIGNMDFEYLTTQHRQILRASVAEGPIMLQ